jgi:hypothetical protein
MNTPYKENNYLNKRDYFVADENNNNINMNANNNNSSNVIHSNIDIGSSGTGSTTGKKKPRVREIKFFFS